MARATQASGSSPSAYEATPFYYTVLPGETLAGIATRFGVAPEAIQEANGLASPDLQPGQTLFIPLRAAIGAPEETLVRFATTNTPPPLSLAAPTCLRTSADEVLCIGWIDNPLDRPISGVRIATVLHSVDGAVLDQRTATLVQQAVLPAEGAPYAVRFPAGLRAFAWAEAQLLAADLTGFDQLGSVPLTITTSRQSNQDGLIRVQGTARHDGQGTLTDLLVTITLFDQTGQVSGFRVDRPPGRLEPGNSLEIDLLLTPLLAGTTRHIVYAEGRPVTGG